MVRENRIKEYKFDDMTFSATTTNTYYSDHPLNGELLSVEWSFNRAGSMSLALSGTGEEFFRRNAPSGVAGIQFAYPRTFTQSTTGSIAGADHTPFLMNSLVGLSLGSALSGTQALTCTLKYR